MAALNGEVGKEMDNTLRSGRLNSRLLEWLSTSLSAMEVLGSIPGRVKSDTVLTFLQSCVVQALSRGDGSRHLLHASMQYRENNEDLIFYARIA